MTLSTDPTQFLREPRGTSPIRRLGHRFPAKATTREEKLFSLDVVLRRCGSGRDWRPFERTPALLLGSDPAFVPPGPTARAWCAHRDGRSAGGGLIVELSWTQDINPEVNKLAGDFGLVPSRRYRIYETRP